MSHRPIAGRVVAIDGPAGAGKSTVGRALARRLGMEYLDTGAMYRAVTWAAHDRGIDVADGPAVAALGARCVMRVGEDGVFVDGVDVTAEIRSAAVTSDVSAVAANTAVRADLRRRQRQWGDERGGGVIEGRDIGSVVFPDAALKVYLTADATVRASRRATESGADATHVEREMTERDRHDATRHDGPLVAADGSVTVDTTDRTVDEVVAVIVGLAAERLAPADAPDAP